MTNIDFFGCSFTAPTGQLIYPPTKSKIDIQLYSYDAYNTKTLSSFLDFDLAYNNNDYTVNNYGKASFGNFTISNVIENKIKKLNKDETNIAIVQLSSLLRNEVSWSVIQDNKRYFKDKDVYDIDFKKVRPDYFCETIDMNEYYYSHILNLEKMVDLLKANYDRFKIFFGWDIMTPHFIKLFNEWEHRYLVGTYPYNYTLSSSEGFENVDAYNFHTKQYTGQYGGLLEYSSNNLEEVYRYVGGKINDHHPSYFSNKIFYQNILRKFLISETDLNFDKTYFEEDSVAKIENFLKEMLVKKRKGGEYEDYNESQLQKEIIMHIRKTILS
jgi:hypothetical protein